jgi:hypothetical protein
MSFDIGGLIMGGHKCSKYEPKTPKLGDTYKFCCGREYICTRRYPWTKWEVKDGR